MWTDLYDAIAGAFIDFRIGFFQEVQNIQSKGTVPGTYLIDDKILIREVFEQIL